VVFVALRPFFVTAKPSAHHVLTASSPPTEALDVIKMKIHIAVRQLYVYMKTSIYKIYKNWDNQMDFM